MKGIKMRFLKKLKSIPTINSKKQTIVSELNPLEKLSQKNDTRPTITPGSLSLCELVNDTDDEYFDSSFHLDDKENFTPAFNSKCLGLENDESSSSEDDISSFRERERLNEVSLKCPLSDFEAKCPPEGADSIILYTTSLRGIRKTFEDCKTVGFLLKSFKIAFHKRDVSMDLEFRDELWKIMGGRVVPPRLFIKGRYIGGAEEVVTLHEQGKLRKLMHGIPVHQSHVPCDECGGVGFIVCLDCNGSCKVYNRDGDDDEDDMMFIRCSECNENGLIKCRNCH